MNKLDNFSNDKVNLCLMVEKGFPSRRPTNKSGSKLTWILKVQVESCFVGFKGNYNLKDWTYKLKNGQLELGGPRSRLKKEKRRPMRRRTNVQIVSR